MAPTTRRPNWSVEKEFLAELTAARREFMETESEMLWELLGGNLAEGVFLQMVARVGMEAIASSPQLREAMWSHVPANARGYRP